MLHGTDSPIGTPPTMVRAWCGAWFGLSSDYTRETSRINCPRCLYLGERWGRMHSKEKT